MEPKAVLLTVAYDGTEFCGWQAQPGLRTVEGVLSPAILAMAGAPLRIRAASRTDSGVHALGQPVAFDPTRSIDAHGWQRGLNQSLPADIRVRSVDYRTRGFDPRYRANGKLYRYVLSLGCAVNPVVRNQVWHIDARRARPAPPHPRRAHIASDWLDIEAMAEAASIFVGTHDFRAFQGANDERESTVRTLHRVEVLPRWANDPELIAIEVAGTAFLKNMVRILVGTIVEVGRERTTATRVAAMLGEHATRPDAGPTAPGSGLTLVSVSLDRAPRPGMDVTT